MSRAAQAREHPDRGTLPGAPAPAPGPRARVEARATAQAPLRISLAGGGTDVPPLARGIGGRVVAAALGLHVRATVEPFDPGWISLEGAWGLADTPSLVATVTRRAHEPPATDVASVKSSNCSTARPPNSRPTCW